MMLDLLVLIVKCHTMDQKVMCNFGNEFEYFFYRALTFISLNNGSSHISKCIASYYYTIDSGCAVNNGGCAQICTDTQASFECSCNTGYILDSDGLSCRGMM